MRFLVGIFKEFCTLLPIGTLEDLTWAAIAALSEDMLHKSEHCNNGK